MGRNLFSVPIFFIVFRETLEAAIIVSVLLGLAEQIVYDHGRISPTAIISDETSSAEAPSSEDVAVQRKRLIRKLRFQVEAE